MITIALNDQASPRLARLKELLPSRRIMAAIGVGAERVFKDHFLMREGEPNKNNWPKQHIWARISRATQLVQAAITPTSCKITIADPIMGTKIDGAHIIPKGTNRITGKPLRNIAIPFTAEAYGTSPKNLNNLRFTIDPEEGPVLIRAEAMLIKLGGRKGAKRMKAGAAVGGEIMYLLRSHADIPKDPRALPKTEAIIEAAAKVVDREVAKTQNKT